MANAAESYLRALVNRLHRTGKGIYPLEVELSTSWGECITDWLGPSEVLLRRREPDSHYLAYRFPKAREVAHDEVLNHHILHRGKLVPRRPFEGYLVAKGEPMPADIKHGQRHELDLTIIGSDHTEYTQTISFWVDRVVPRAAARGGETRRSGWTGWRRRDPGVGAHALVSDCTRIGRNRIFGRVRLTNNR